MGSTESIRENGALASLTGKYGSEEARRTGGVVCSATEIDSLLSAIPAEIAEQDGTVGTIKELARMLVDTSANGLFAISRRSVAVCLNLAGVSLEGSEA